MQARKRSGTRSAASSTSRPPEPLTFFLDESLDGASVVAALRDAGALIERLTEHFQRIKNPIPRGPLTPKQLKSMVSIRALRGRPKSASTKQLVSVRYSPEVLAYFRPRRRI